MFNYIFIIISAISSALILTLNIYNFKIIRITLKETLKCMIILFLVISVILVSFEFLFLPVIFIVMLTFFYFNHKNIIKSIVSIILSYLAYSVIDAFLGTILLKILKINMKTFQNNIPLRLFLISIVFIVTLLVSRIIGIVIKKFNFNKIKIEKKSRITVFTLINIITVCIIVYINAMINKFMHISTSAIALNSILFIIYFISIMTTTYFYGLDLKKQIEYENRKKEFNQLKEYTSMLEQMYNDMRKFRHDYINILSSINGYIDNGNMKELQKYFNENIVPLSGSISSKNTKLGLLQHVKVVGLKGLLSSKIIKAQSLDIDTFIDISEDICRIDMDTVDLCRAVGILFDNAIEASSLCSEPKIEFGIIKKKNSVIIVIINSYTGNIPPVYKLFQKGFSTKGEKRGVGLSNVKEIVDKSDNIMLNTSAENEMFKQELNIKFKS